MSHSKRRNGNAVRVLWLAALPLACTGVIAQPAGNGGGTSSTPSQQEPEISTNCGQEFQRCCTAKSMASCEGDIKCNDSACVACEDIPALTSGCTNVAFGGTATADATEGGDEANRGANLAIDGSACTRWSSGELPSDEAAGRGQTVWQVDLGAAHRIDNLTLWLAMTPAGDVNLALEYGDDGAHWQAEWSGTRPMSGWEPWQYAMTQPTTARYFRVVFFNGPSWSAIRELALWECPDPPSSDGGGDGGGTSPSP